MKKAVANLAEILQRPNSQLGKGNIFHLITGYLTWKSKKTA